MCGVYQMSEYNTKLIKYLALLGRSLRLSFIDPSENRFWPESGRRLSSGPETTVNPYQIAVWIQWNTSQPSKSVFCLFFQSSPK